MPNLWKHITLFLEELAHLSAEIHVYYTDTRKIFWGCSWHKVSSYHYIQTCINQSKHQKLSCLWAIGPVSTLHLLTHLNAHPNLSVTVKICTTKQHGAECQSLYHGQYSTMIHNATSSQHLWRLWDDCWWYATPTSWFASFCCIAGGTNWRRKVPCACCCSSLSRCNIVYMISSTYAWRRSRVQSQSWPCHCLSCGWDPKEKIKSPISILALSLPFMWMRS